MNSALRSITSFLVVLVLACGGASSGLAAKKIPKARLAKGVYTSPGRVYSIKVPALLEPGSWNEERQTTPETQGAFFGDDMGRGFFILLTDNRGAKLTLDSIATEYQVGEGLREKAFVTTPRGTELRLAGIVKGGSPLVSRTKHDGKWVEERLDKVFAQSLFLYGENILQITMATTTLKGDTRTEPELMDDAKKRLDLALEGLELLPQR